MRTRSLFVQPHAFMRNEAHEVQTLSPNQHRHVSAATANGWKSPVPYLFGGLAAMLGLIAFALLILACSYWKLSGQMDSGENSGDEDGAGHVKDEKKGVVYPNSILVIMAGEEKPTYLATPATSRTTSFGDTSENKGSCSCSCSSSSSSDGDDESIDKDVELTTTTARRVSSSSHEEEKS